MVYRNLLEVKQCVLYTESLDIDGNNHQVASQLFQTIEKSDNYIFLNKIEKYIPL